MPRVRYIFNFTSGRTTSANLAIGFFFPEDAEELEYVFYKNSESCCNYYVSDRVKNHFISVLHYPIECKPEYKKRNYPGYSCCVYNSK